MEDAITKNFSSFDPVVFLETKASNLNRSAAIEQFERAIDKIANNTKNPYNLVEWCINVKNFSYEILNSDETKKYWILKSKTTLRLINELNRVEDDPAISENITNISSSVNRKISMVQRMKRKADVVSKCEDDCLVFNGISVATKLKRFAELKFNHYEDLSNKEQHVVG